jgi:tetratricopeptide (TPR) repeat protein
MPRKCKSKSRKLSVRETHELDVKIGFMEGLVHRDPKYVEALQILGDHYSERGRYGESLEVDKKLSELEPANPLVFYNLACSHSLNGDLKLAQTSLEKAINLGYRDFRWMSRDPDLTKLRQDPIYQKIEDRVREIKSQAGQGG